MITVANLLNIQLLNKRKFNFVVEYSLFINIQNNMKNDIISRFKLIANEKSESITAFSNAIGISQSTLSCQLNSVKGLKLEVVLSVLNSFPDISAEWLLRGKGEMKLLDNIPTIKGEESDNELDLHADIARKTAELEEYKVQVLRLEAQKDYLQQRNDDLIITNRMLQDELNKYQEPRKKSIS